MTQVPPNNIAVFSVGGLDANGNPKPITGTIQVGNYSLAYVAYDQFGHVMFVPKSVPQGLNQNVDVVVKAKDANGAGLPDKTYTFQLVATPFPDPAVETVITVINVRDTIGVNVPADPGADTIAIQ